MVRVGELGLWGVGATLGMGLKNTIRMRKQRAGQSTHAKGNKISSLSLFIVIGFFLFFLQNMQKEEEKTIGKEVY